MARILKSYVQGRWVQGEGDLRPLVDPTTEEVLAEAGTGGVDFAAALSYARSTGTPALQGMTFAQRGRMIGDMSKAIHAKRDELIELAIANGGNTRSDAKFDIDGGTFTLSTYAKIGESLGDRRVLTDGEVAQLGRSPRFVGQHVRVPLTGAAVHINAFNFPAWGYAEKAAVALLAGMPVISKPATSTALVAARITEVVVEAGVLPVGALSFIAGGVGDLLDHMTSQDVLAFTGSGATGALLRGREDFIRKSIRVNVEADSLNAAVLGPDVERGSDTWDLFVRELARDMTQKAGQKCTAIRRVFVPKERMVDARADLADELARVRVGDPRLKEVRMGPVATASQLADVRAGIDRLCSEGKPVIGAPGRGELMGVHGDKGYFQGPVLLQIDNPAEAQHVHNHEVFGPVASLMPYDGDPGQAVELVRRGGGGLVSSVYTDDSQVASTLVLGIAPFHGRVHVGSAKVAEHSPGPGTVLPLLVHGGPGRAGGGEELGGERGLSFYMQRTAVQGLKPLLAKMLGGSEG